MFQFSFFFPILNIGFSFGTLQALGKTPQEIDRLQIVETGFAKMSEPSFKNVLERFFYSSGFRAFNMLHDF